MKDANIHTNKIVFRGNPIVIQIVGWLWRWLSEVKMYQGKRLVITIKEEAK